eukprot:jgi/Tetstr1/456182/TSEL_042950.t1
MAAAKHVAVVGGGFVGLSCALQIQRSGHRVTLLERAASVAGPASASYGNAGTFAVYANVPVNKPGIVWDLPRMLTSPTSPLSMKPTPHILKMVPWFLHFLRNCRPQAVDHSAMALASLLMRAEAGYGAVWEQAGVDIDGAMGRFASDPDKHGDLRFSGRHGYLLLQKTPAAMEGAQAGLALRRKHLGPQLCMDCLSLPEVQELEPNLADSAARGGAVWFPDGWFLREPDALLRALADGFVRRGGVVQAGEDGDVRQLSQGQDALRLQLGESGRRSLEVDQVVVAAGAHSASLAASVGDWCPLDTERGHHVSWGEGSEAVFTRAVCDPSQGFISTPMAAGLRSAGTVELGGVHAGLTPARCDQLDRATAGLLRPEAAAALGSRNRAADWLGFRPTMPDALPVIGRSSKVPEVIYAFGHQHVGWTLGGITGQLVAELVDGKLPSVDLAPFQPDRFRLWG